MTRRVRLAVAVGLCVGLLLQSCSQADSERARVEADKALGKLCAARTQAIEALGEGGAQ